MWIMPKKDLPIYMGIFLISMASLVLEISLTRVFSVAQWYHFAFLVVSIALFGIGASGTFLSVLPRVLERELNESLATYSGLFSLSCIFSFIVANNIPFDPFKMAWDPMQILYIAVYYLLLAFPFFFSGLCIGTALSKIPREVNRLYFSDLVGAGLGSMLFLLLLPPLSGSGVIVFSAVLGTLSSFSFSLNLSKRVRDVALFGAVILLILLFNPPSILEINISPYKSLKMALRYPNSRLLSTQWNAFSRIDVIESPFVRYAPGLSYEYAGEIPPQLGITMDGNGLMAITQYDGRPLEFTRSLPTALAYQFERGQKVLVVDSGGGMEVLVALSNGASSITATETNPIIADLVRERYGEFSGHIYEDEKVEVVVMDGRSFLKGNDEKYDVIQLALAGSAPASSTGVYALSENYLYTIEAFEDFYEHLSEDGILSITRWLLPPPREGIRIVSLALSALESQGAENPQNRIAVIRSWSTITILVRNGEFTSQDIREIKEFSREKKFDVVYYPNIKPEEVNIYTRFPEPYYYKFINELLTAKEREKFYDDYLFDITPVTDERPFFFHFFKAKKIVPTYESMGKKWQPFVEGGYLVPIIFIQALILSFILIFLPVYRFRKVERSIPGRWQILAYFLCLGVGYMFIEIALIQKFILFLGHPVYSVSTILFALLVTSGMGSLFSNKFEVKDGRILVPIIATISILTVLYLTLLPAFFDAFLGYGLLIRRLISPILLAPLGFFMGMPFPIGIKLAEILDRDLIPWAWAVNGCASVLSSVLSVMIALSLGFSMVLALASFVYLAGLGMILSLRF